MLNLGAFASMVIRGNLVQKNNKNAKQNLVFSKHFLPHFGNKIPNSGFSSPMEEAHRSKYVTRDREPS
jgi:hypothetical protein